MITSSNTMALNNHCATALGPRLGLGLRLDFGSQVWFVQYFSENLVVVLLSVAKELSEIKISDFTSLFDPRFFSTPDSCSISPQRVPTKTKPGPFESPCSED